MLGIISAHATSTALPALLAKHPSLPPSPSPDRDLDGGARLTRSYPSPSPICLHADLSALYLYQVVHQPLPPSISSHSSPGSAKDRYGRTLALSSLRTPTGLCQQVTGGPASSSTHVQSVFCSSELLLFLSRQALILCFPSKRLLCFDGTCIGFHCFDAIVLTKVAHQSDGKDLGTC